MRKRRQIHASSLKVWRECGKKFELRYMGPAEDGEEITSVVVCVGSAVDKAVSADLTNKMFEGKLLPDEHITNLATKLVADAFDNDLVHLNKTESASGLEKVRALAIKKAVRLSLLHHKNLAPKLNPTEVQYPFSVDLDLLLHDRGLPRGYDLVGTMDIREGDVIRDTKTSGRMPDEDAVVESDQLTGYATAHWVETGELPRLVILDYLVDVGGGTLVTQTATRSWADVGVFLDDLADLVRAIEAGELKPKPTWRCRMCEFRDDCEYHYDRRKKMAALQYLQIDRLPKKPVEDCSVEGCEEQASFSIGTSDNPEPEELDEEVFCIQHLKEKLDDVL